MASVTAAVKRIGRLLRRVARIRYRLLLVNLLVAGVPLIGISFAERHEAQLLSGLEDDMIHQAQLVRAQLLATSATTGTDATVMRSFEPVLRVAAHDTHTRIRLLDVTGAVVADSHRTGPPEGAERPVPHLLRGSAPTHDAEPPRPVELAERREVKAALAGRYGSATRLWGKQERVYLFSALPIVVDRPQGRGQPAVEKVIGAVYVTRSTHDVKMQMYRLRTWLIRVLAATLAGTVLLSLMLSTTIARPLGRLTRRAQRIAKRQPVDDGDRLSARADEIGELAQAVEAMTDELERRARDARSLAADISHEFKTPLAGIRGAAELLRDGAADEPEARERFLAMILDDAARLDRQVSRLLELARVDDDRGIALPVDLGELARATAARTWRGRHGDMAVEVDLASPVVVHARAGQLAAAIENLVANAAQHAEASSRVTIAIARRDELVRVTVANRGPALSAHARRKVWDRFYSTRSGDGGSGLGLAIVRSVALAHGGAVGVDCRDGVTAFWFEILGA